MTADEKNPAKKRKSTRRKDAKQPAKILAGPKAGDSIQNRIKRKTKLGEEVGKELRSLRSDFQQAVEKLSLRTEGRMARLAEIFEGNAGSAEENRLPAAKVTESILSILRRFKAKPNKGRVKDILNYCRIVKHIEVLLPPEK